MGTRLAWMIALSAALLAAAVMSAMAGASLGRSAAALGLVYLLGYVPGSLLVDPQDDRQSLSLGIVRLIAGLMLTTIAFFLSLLLWLPWYLGPVVLFALAAIRNRSTAFALPRSSLSFSQDGALTGLVGLLLVAPIVISAMRMAPGEFPPVFFNVDTPYFLEKVHALVKTSVFPPESLSFADGRRSYHFGVHGLAALISRGSGLAPHHALFLIVLPLLAGGVLAAALVLARRLSPSLPLLVAVPMLLVSVPTLWYPFWHSVWPPLWQSVTTLSLEPLALVTQDYELWGAASNNGQNIAAHFLVLASLAGLLAAPAGGWRLPVFLVGSAVLFKAPTGVALAAGFSVAQAVRALRARSLRPLVPAVAAAVVFGGVYGAFWLLPPVPIEFRTEIFPFFHLTYLEDHGGRVGFVLDVAWLLLPAIIVWLARAEAREPHGRLPLLVFAAAPFVVVNVLRSIDLRPGFGVDEDWVQIMLPVPILLHAFVLGTADSRWAGLGAGYRRAFLFVIALTVLPPVLVAGRYAEVLIVDPERGHEFVDNRPLAEALAAIPTDNTIVVTNDLRYPAEGFGRDNRQMQIPALFGHQAFAVNYAYEAYAFSRDRQRLQALLRGEQWSDAIEQAARTYHWTHLLIRKDYAHPDRIPLDLAFDNQLYSVYRFKTP